LNNFYKSIVDEERRIIMYSPVRIEEAETGGQPPYKEGRLLYFWFLYDWESRNKLLLLQPPDPEYKYKPNEKLYRCELGIDPPHLDDVKEIVASVVFEEDKTKKSMGEEGFAAYLTRQIFLNVNKMVPPGTYGNDNKVEARILEDVRYPTIIVKTKWGKYVVKVEKLEE
jgi:hypothetical protein